MNLLFSLPYQQVFDQNGDILSGALVYFYDPGTTNDRTVYQDRLRTTPHTQPVVANAGGWIAPVYPPDGPYKVVVKDAGGLTIWTADNVDGPLDTSTFLQDSDLVLDSPVVSKTTTYTVVAGDKGKIINANPTGGSFTITLLSAVTAGDGFPLTIRHVGTANQVTIEAITGQTIDGRVGLSLTDRYQSLNIVSDGANWHVVALSENIRGQTPVVKITDRLTSPPTSPTPGARYIITGTPTGAWSSYSEHDIVEATGTGAWVQIVPADGWQAFVDDEDTQYQLRAGAWVAWSNITAPDPSYEYSLIAAHTEATNTGGGTNTANAWTKMKLNTNVANGITGASHDTSGYTITLPAGRYRVKATAVFHQTNKSAIRLSGSTNSITGQWTYWNNGTAIQGAAHLSGTLNLSAQETFELQYYTTQAFATGLGAAANISGETERYALLEITDISQEQGPTGSQGAQGADGLDAAFDYQWSTATSGDPGSGKILMNNATFASVTQINISETTASGADIAAEMATWDDSTSTVRAKVHIRKEGAPANYQILAISGAGTDQGGYWTFPVTPIDDGGTIANGNDVAVLLVPKGDKGDTGATGAAGAAGSTGATGAAGPTVAVGFNYSTTTADADPGSGIFRLNNATLASVTEAYFDNSERGGTDVSAWLDTFDDSGESSYRGTLTLIDTADSTEVQVYKVTGSVTDGTGYRKVSLTWIAGKAAGSFTNGGEIAVSFAARGASGAGDMDSVTYDPAGVSEQLVGLTATQTLTNKTLTQPVLTLEQGASVAPTAEGRIAWDTDDNRLKVGDGSATKTFSSDDVWSQALASTSNGEGASLIGIEDAATLITATTVEGALAENRAAIDAIEADYLTSGAIGVSVQAYNANLTTWAGIAPSANGQSLVAAANYAAMRTLLDLEAGTDFYSISAADAAFQPIDADLTAIAALTTTAAGRSILELTDPNADRVMIWDDSGGALVAATLGGGLFISGTGLYAYETIVIACSDETTALTTGTAKVTFRMPFAMTLTAVRASVTTAPTGSALTVDINEGGTTILSTKLTIDATEKTSTTAATAAVISDASLADDAEMTIDIDAVGSTIAGAGLKVTLIGYRP